MLNTHDLCAYHAKKPLFQGLNITILPGECWAILGENGAGKSTLLHNLAGFSKPHSGEIYYLDKPLAHLKHRARTMGLLLQHAHYTLPLRVYDAVHHGRYPHASSAAHNHEQVTKALAIMGLSTLQHRLVHTLSGGEQQRVALATVLAQDPQYYFLDEPSNHLDLRYKLSLFQHIKNLIAQKKSVILCTHDTSLLSQCADYCLILEKAGTHFIIKGAEIADKQTLKKIYQLSEADLTLW